MAALPRDALVAVVGAGTMGAGIAQVAASSGHEVLLFDADADTARGARHAISSHLDRAIERGRMSEAEAERVLERVRPCVALDELSPAALVIEAIVEDMEAKRALFGRLEGVVSEGAILATNTSSLSVTALAAGLRRQGRVVGMHFFNPAPVMALVEVVRGIATGGIVAETVFDTAAAWGKSPVHARSTPGFVVNRVARPFYGEALRTLEEGACDPATLDAVMREAGGFRMGPCQLMDLVGIDVNWAVTNSVYRACFDEPRFRPSRVQAEMVDAGRLGRKTKRGFYDYAEGAAPPEPAAVEPGGAPPEVRVLGALGPAEGLLARAGEAGLRLVRADGPGVLEVGGVILAPSDGRPATQRAAEEGRPDLVVFDLALDWRAVTRIAAARADQAGAETLSTAAGFFAALGIAVSPVDDVPGLLLTRTVAMLANCGADAMQVGVADAAGVDTAMQAGVNYPRGPLAWADALGADFVVRVLENMQRATGEDRYRPALLLRRKAWAGGRFHG